MVKQPREDALWNIRRRHGVGADREAVSFGAISAFPAVTSNGGKIAIADNRPTRRNTNGVPTLPPCVDPARNRPKPSRQSSSRPVSQRKQCGRERDLDAHEHSKQWMERSNCDMGNQSSHAAKPEHAEHEPKQTHPRQQRPRNP